MNLSDPMNQPPGVDAVTAALIAAILCGVGELLKALMP